MKTLSSKKMESIYRFVSFPSFVDTIQRKALTFVHHSLWEDPNEGRIFKALKLQEGPKKILGILKQLSLELAMPTYATLKYMDSCIHAQSWTKCPENNHFWQVPSGDQYSIRIEVSLENIKRLEHVTAYEIQYVDTTLKNDLVAVVDAKKRQANLAPILLRKRPQYAYEQEIRLLSDIDLDYMRTSRSPRKVEMMESALRKLGEVGQISKKEYETGMTDLRSQSMPVPKYRYIKFNHIPDFVKSIMVNPGAPDWFVETVETYCSINNQHFVGKSRFHDLII